MDKTTNLTDSLQTPTTHQCQQKLKQPTCITLRTFLILCIFIIKNDSLKSNIVDTKNSTAHYFHVDKKDSLIFLRTENFKKEDKTYSYTFSDVKIKKDRKEIKLKIKNHTDRRTTRYKLTVKETDENYFPFFQLNGMMETFYFMELVTPLNFMVLEAKGYYSGGGFGRYTLKSVEEIDLLVNVPD